MQQRRDKWEREQADGRKRVWKWKTPVADLRVGQEFEGTVLKNLKGHGLFVDIKAERSGWLHASEIQENAPIGFKIPMKEGDRVWVRVLNVDPVREMFKLTCIPGSLDRSKKLKEIPRVDDMSPFLNQMPFEGTITDITVFGAVVKVHDVTGGEEVMGLIRKGDVPEYLRSELKAGDKVKMKLLSADERKGEISFLAFELNGDEIQFSNLDLVRDEDDMEEDMDEDMDEDMTGEKASQKKGAEAAKGFEGELGTYESVILEPMMKRIAASK